MQPRGDHHADRGAPRSGRCRRRPTSERFSAKSGIIAARRKPPNPPSAVSSSMTASWCRGCATAPGSPPARSTRFAPICPNIARHAGGSASGSRSAAAKPLNGATAAAEIMPPGFRFFDNRQKYLLFVSTCSEKTEIAQPGFARTRQSAANAAGASDVRCRGWRRHRAVAGDAGAACPLSHHAALRRRQGNLLRRRADDAGEDGRPPVRASRYRARRHQPLLCRGAVADAAFGDVGARPDLEGRRAVRQHRARLCRADRRARGISGRELARRNQPDDRQSRLPAARSS